MTQETRWKRDGWEATVRIGVLIPHADVGPESELQAMAPLDEIVYGFTSSAYAIASEGEAEMIARLEERTRGIPMVATCRAAVEGLRVFGARRIVLIDPLASTPSSTLWEDGIASRLASRSCSRRRVG